MISIFVDREDELALLEREWRKRGGRLVVLYGRRRIGKTRLLMEFIHNKQGVFYIAEDTSPRIQLSSFKNKLARFLDDELLDNIEIRDWDQLFAYLAKNMPKRRFYIIIDEFTYLIRGNRGILSVLQKYWDTVFIRSPIYIVISGSLLGMMNDEVLSSASPLYGRRTRDILLGPLSLKHIGEFVPFSFEDRLKLYFIIGGVPEYLIKASEYKSLKSFLLHEFLNKTGYFFREPIFMISQEFRDLKVYFAILNAIAFGNTRPTDIANFVGIETRRIYPYLEGLIRLGYVERTTPILINGRKGVYQIKDNVIDYWFNSVYKHRENIERDLVHGIIEDSSDYFGKKFEAFVRDEMMHRIDDFDRVGKWWHKGEEIDVVAVNERTSRVTFIECKWGHLKAKDVKRLVRRLKEKAELVAWRNDHREEHFAVVARRIENKESLQKEGISVFDMRDIKRLFA